MKKITRGIVGLVAVCILFVVLFGIYRFNFLNGGGNLPGVACTMEAKVCPDGSSVSRGGPQCEFALCPSLGQEGEPQPKPESSFIAVSEPKQNDRITSPLVIRGEARGAWYFEATFPLSLEDENGKVIATGTAQAEGDWMTESFVPFTATLSYVSEKEQGGVLVLKNDNPSGLLENAQELRIPVTIIRSSKGSSGAEFVSPIDRASERVTKKPFGILIDPKTSPVQPERFSGYHTGTDFETFSDEQGTAVSIRAVCTGTLIEKKWATGYGGVIVERCQRNNETVTVVYGHMSLQSIGARVGESIEAGSIIGVLGAAKSRETDGERKHLHLSIHQGPQIDIRGYVASQQELGRWLDPCLFVCK